MTTALVKIPATTYKRGAYVDRYGHKHPAKTIKREGYKKKVRRKRKGRTPKGKRWYAPKVHSGWEKTMPAGERRRLLLKAHGNPLSAARSKQALANVTQDVETKELALADAKYFFEQHRRSK